MAPGRKEPSDRLGHKIPESHSATPPAPLHSHRHRHRPQRSPPSASIHKLPNPALLRGTIITHPPAPAPLKHGPHVRATAQRMPPLLPRTRTRLTCTEAVTAWGSICAPTHRRSTDPRPLGPGPRPGQTGIQTHPWGPPVTLTAAEQDGRAKARTAATPRGPRRCPRCPRCQRPSARPCPRRRPTSLASAGPRAGAAAGPRRTGRREGPGRGCGPAGGGGGARTEDPPTPRPPRAGPAPTPLPSPLGASGENCLACGLGHPGAGSRIPRAGSRIPSPGSSAPGPRQLPEAHSGSRAGGTVGLRDRRRLGLEKTAEISDSGSRFGLPPRGFPARFSQSGGEGEGPPTEYASVVPADHGRQESSCTWTRISGRRWAPRCKGRTQSSGRG